MRRPTRVLVLGGGMAGVAAAFRLSDSADKRARVQVTLLQHGWRLGGKGASGRDPLRQQRIEEHGLHVWMGFYAHAFGLVRDALATLAPGRAAGELARSFRPEYAVRLTTAAGAGFDLKLPPRPGLPWDPGSTDWRQFFAELARWVGSILRGGVDLGGSRALAALAAHVARGLLVDVLPYGERGFDRIDAWDLRDWLRRHGARDPAVLDAPPVLAFYALAFAHPDGRSGPGRGSVAAGAALRAILRMLLSYRGAPFWRLTSGMGDAVFAPMYLALVQQGVQVDFFTRVEALQPARDAARLDVVRVRRQATPRGIYTPLITVQGRPAWPNHPLYAQLVDGHTLGDAALESYHCPVGAPATLAIGRDFDVVVNAIPIDAHTTIAGELLARFPPLRTMVEHHRSVATRALQVWLDRPRPAEQTTVGSGLAPPFSSWGDMTDVLAAEDWTDLARPRSLLYFVDACPDPTPGSPPPPVELPALLGRVPGVPPGASPIGGGLYQRINHEIGERYILTPPGSTRYRLAPDASGVANLFLAGDWTRTSLNGGSVEAAAESGTRAAAAVLARFG